MPASERTEMDYQGWRLVEELGRAFLRNEPYEAKLGAVLERLGAVAPEAVVWVDSWMRDRLRNWRPEQTWSWLRRFSDERAFNLELLSRADGLEVLFLSHPDGRFREQALRKLEGGLPSPYAFALVALRLNDWVEPVRRAAMECVGRTYPKTSAEIIGRAAPHVIASSLAWRRWTIEGEALDAALSASGAAGAVIDRFRTATTGPIGRLLRAALRGPSYDHGLMELATKARIPHVRALALKTLIAGEASWVGGYERQWIDKTMGEFRPAPVIARRRLSDPPDPAEMIGLGARDSSAAVRRAAADGFVARWREFENLGTLLELFRADDSAPVRWRIDFIRRRLSEHDAAIAGDAPVAAG